MFQMMEIVSLNVRGLGGSINRKYIRDLISKEQVDMICLQETKCSEISKENGFLLWGSNNIGWIEVGASNNAGGIITMSRNSRFQLVNYFRGNNFSTTEGVWKGGGVVQIMIVNVYSPNSLREKKILWEEISDGVRTIRCGVYLETLIPFEDRKIEGVSS